MRIAGAVVHYDSDSGHNIPVCLWHVSGARCVLFIMGSITAYVQVFWHRCASIIIVARGIMLNLNRLSAPSIDGQRGKCKGRCASACEPGLRVSLPRTLQLRIYSCVRSGMLLDSVNGIETSKIVQSIAVPVQHYKSCTVHVDMSLQPDFASIH